MLEVLKFLYSAYEQTILNILYVFTFVIVPVSLVCYCAYIKYVKLAKHTKDEEYRRKVALKIAQIYLSPYTDIWSNLKLTNKFCSLSLGTDGVTITCREKGGFCRKFVIVQSNVHSIDDLWNMFCKNFDHYKTYEGLLQDCYLYNVSVKEKSININENNNFEHYSPEKLVKIPKDKIDINNASEVEITALPGISIVMAKKLIKKREEVGGFKNISEVFAYLRLKPHMENQLKELICTNKKQGTLNIKKYSERKVDL